MCECDQIQRLDQRLRGGLKSTTFDLDQVPFSTCNALLLLRFYAMPVREWEKGLKPGHSLLRDTQSNGALREKATGPTKGEDFQPCLPALKTRTTPEQRLRERKQPPTTPDQRLREGPKAQRFRGGGRTTTQPAWGRDLDDQDKRSWR